MHAYTQTQTHTHILPRHEIMSIHNLKTKNKHSTSYTDLHINFIPAPKYPEGVIFYFFLLNNKIKSNDENVMSSQLF